MLGFSYGGRIAMRVVNQHPGWSAVRGLVLASTTAYAAFASELATSIDYVARRRLCTQVGFDNPVLTSSGAPDGALSRAMAFGRAPRDVWRLGRLDDYHRVLERVRFSSDYNRPFTTGTLRSGAPDDPVAVLRDWGGPVLILHGARAGQLQSRWVGG